jgi:hypothetical protein
LKRINNFDKNAYKKNSKIKTMRTKLENIIPLIRIKRLIENQ